jgi:3-isopropylmalate/(R)-2-methylmalate dehydratase small subunit
MKIKGRAWTFGANINTDLIFPKMYFRPNYEPGELATHLLAGIDPDFPAKASPNDVIVAGPNFGCGSSREEAAAAMKEFGIGAVVAPSFSRLFMRNGINFGLPVLTSANIDQQVAEGDTIEIDLTGGHLKNITSGYETRLPPLSPEALRMMQDGGIKAYTRRILEERKAAAASVHTNDPAE